MTVNPLCLLVGIISVAGSGSLLRIYTNPVPSAGGPIGDAVLLGTVGLASPLGDISSDATNYILALGIATPDLVADARGTATWARVTAVDNTWVCDLDVTASGQGGAITTNNVNIVQVGTITLMSGEIRVLK